MIFPSWNILVKANRYASKLCSSFEFDSLHHSNHYQGKRISKFLQMLLFSSISTKTSVYSFSLLSYAIKLFKKQVFKTCTVKELS